MNLLHYFNKKRELSPSNRKEYSLNEHGYVDLKNQFIDSSDLANKYEKLVRCHAEHLKQIRI